VRTTLETRENSVFFAGESASMQTKPFMVGITGGSASGKTMFIKKLVEAFPQDQICLLSQDNYYRDRHLQPKDEKGVENFDLPESIDHEQFIQDVRQLHHGKTVIKKEYTFNNPDVVARMLEFQPAPVIVVEGIFVFYFPEILRQLDLKIFIDAEEHIKLKRRIKRDGQERGYDMEDVLYRYEHHVAPTFDRYIKPFKSEADLIIPNNRHFNNALDVLVTFLKARTAKS
jgi:uridine kinase